MIVVSLLRRQISGGRQVVIMDRLNYGIAMIGLLIRPESHYKKRSVNAMITAHKQIWHKVECIGQVLSDDRNEAGGIQPENPNLEYSCC